MRTNSKCMKYYILFIILSFSCLLYGQDTKVTNDFLTWYGIGLSKDITKSLELDIRKEFRLNKDGTDLYKHLTYTSINYQVFKHVYFGLGIKFIRDKDKEEIFQDKYTHMLDIQYKNKINRLEYLTRFRLEQNSDKLMHLKSSDENSYGYRQKIKLAYKIKDSSFTPFLGSELFYIDSYDESRFEKIRFDIGTSYKINKYNRIKAYYRVAQELNQDFPYTYYSIGFFYTHTL